MIRKFDLLLHFSGCKLFFGSSVTFMVIQGISDSSCNKTRVVIRILLAKWVLFYLWIWHVHYLYNDTCLFKLASTDHWIIQKEGKPQHTEEKFLLFFYVVSTFIFGKIVKVCCDSCSTLLHLVWWCVLERLPELFTSNKSCGCCRIVILCLTYDPHIIEVIWWRYCVEEWVV
jgi:hypothetical protein